jgi:hypothetical protein
LEGPSDEKRSVRDLANLFEAKASGDVGMLTTGGGLLRTGVGAAATVAQPLVDALSRREPLSQRFKDHYAFYKHFGYAMRWEEDGNRWLLAFLLLCDGELRIFDSPTVCCLHDGRSLTPHSIDVHVN